VTQPSVGKRSGSPARYVLVALLLGGALYASRSLLTATPPEPPRTVRVQRGDVVARTLASGRIVPREEIFVRSLVAGVLDELVVRPGAVVKKGDTLAVVRVVADPVLLSEARSQGKLAEAHVARAERELTRLRSVGSGIALSGQELARAEDELRLAQTELTSARERLLFVAEGASHERGARSTRVVAPIAGTVLAVPVAIGDVIGDTNPYRDGTTIAVVADMTDLLFKGQIDEAHVGKLQIDMPATVRIGALEDSAVAGTLLWIAPRATVEAATGPAPVSATASSVSPLNATSSGITRFELWVKLLSPPARARAGYSATAELTLDERKHVLLVEERALRFEGNKTSCSVLTTTGQVESRDLEVGVSDGLNIEVLSGVSEGDRVLVGE
jgi:HlyD family secretion protein